MQWVVSVWLIVILGSVVAIGWEFFGPKPATPRSSARLIRTGILLIPMAALLLLYGVGFSACVTYRGLLRALAEQDYATCVSYFESDVTFNGTAMGRRSELEASLQKSRVTLEEAERVELRPRIDLRDPLRVYVQVGVNDRGMTLQGMRLGAVGWRIDSINSYPCGRPHGFIVMERRLVSLPGW